MNTNGTHRDDMPPAVIAALSQGKKIDAIKILREERGLGLKDAKEAVDRFVASDPSLRARLDTVAAESRRSLMTYAGVLLGLLVVVYVFLRARS